MKKIEELIALLRKKNIQVFLEEGNLRLVYDDNQLTDDLLLELKANKSELIDFLKSLEDQDDVLAIPKIEEAEFYPLSSAQKRLWILSQFSEASVAYNMPFSIELPICCAVNDAGCKLSKAPDVPKSTQDLL